MSSSTVQASVEAAVSVETLKTWYFSFMEALNDVAFMYHQEPDYKFLKDPWFHKLLELLSDIGADIDLEEEPEKYAATYKLFLGSSLRDRIRQRCSMKGGGDRRRIGVLMLHFEAIASMMDLYTTVKGSTAVNWQAVHVLVGKLARNEDFMDDATKKTLKDTFNGAFAAKDGFDRMEMVGDHHTYIAKFSEMASIISSFSAQRTAAYIEGLQLVDTSTIPSEDRCPFCWGNLNDSTTAPVRKTPCNHLFHGMCLQEIFETGSSMCPICKSETIPTSTMAMVE